MPKVVMTYDSNGVPFPPLLPFVLPPVPEFIELKEEKLRQSSAKGPPEKQIHVHTTDHHHNPHHH